MESKQRLRQFELQDVVQVNPSDEMKYDIGHGAFGYVVEMTYRGLKCAGKKFFRDLYCQGNIEERKRMITCCCDECLLLCSLAHPNIVQVLGITFERGNPLPILVMEFVPFTLSTFLDKRGILPEGISYGILVDVATGLCYLHGRNPTIIHRDLTANNILLTSEMKAKIADLGMAKSLNTTPAKTKCPGTVTYMPPEALVENPEYRTEIDLFSYGILLIHVLCGQWPHPGPPKYYDKDGKLVGHSEYERHSKYIEIIGDKHPMIGLIQRCLSDQPAKRPNASMILCCVQESASQFPCQFESILDAKMHISSLTYKLDGAEKQLKLLHQENARTKLNYDILSEKFQQCERECLLLQKKLDDEKEQHRETLKLKEKEHKIDLQEKCSLLDQREIQICGLKKEMQVYTKAQSSELELGQKTKQSESAMKSELDNLRRQIDSLQKQLDAKTCENEILKREQEHVRKISAMSKDLVQNMKLKLDMVKTCEIGNLERELEIKKIETSELRSQQQRVQDYLNSKVRRNCLSFLIMDRNELEDVMLKLYMLFLSFTIM